MRAPAAALLALAALGGARGAGAQTVVNEPPPPAVYLAALREPGRPVIGLDFGIGMLDARCSGCYAEGGLSVDAFGGFQVAPRVALLVDAWALAHLIAAGVNDNGVAAHTLATAGVRVWLVPRFWLQAGLGGGGLLVSGVSRAEDGADFGPAAMFAAGGELGHQPRSGIDLSVRIGGSRIAAEPGDTVLLYSVAAVVGYHWN